MEFISNLMGSGVSVAFTIVAAMVVLLYILSIAFVIKDARSRGASWYFWGIIALVPVIGFIAYIILRPQLLESDRDEQELELALKRRQLMQYGECSHCGYPVDADYILCPHCQQRLKNLCPTCKHALNPEWPVCPYCATTIHGGAPQRNRPQNTGGTRKQSNRPSVSGATGSTRAIK